MTSKKLEYISTACEITTEILRETINELKKNSFQTEIDISRFLRIKTKNRDCELAFSPVIGTGQNGAKIHHKPRKTKLQKGFLVIDFGVKYKGYCSDCTRTVYLGNPSNRELNLYQIVLNSQLTSLQETREGVSCSDLDAISRAAFGEYWNYYNHNLGHGIGKFIHQKPSLGPYGKGYLKKGMVITIEPGLYMPGKLGIRIEDTVLVTKTGYKILTKFNKELIKIKI